MSLLKFPKKSHRKSILIPPDSKDLAEFLGIEFGDGGINNPWQVIISLNSNEDFQYSSYISDLVYRLFGIKVVSRKRVDENTLDLIITSSSVVEFLIDKGAVRGNKVLQAIDVPTWIYSDSLFELAFVRGLIDTDGGFYTHKHNVGGKDYIHLGLCFACFSEPLLLSVGKLLVKYGINPHITRSNKRISLYSKKDLKAYMSIFGSSNARLYNKYSYWIG